jgi:hypothetical protein
MLYTLTLLPFALVFLLYPFFAAKRRAIIQEAHGFHPCLQSFAPSGRVADLGIGLARLVGSAAVPAARPTSRDNRLVPAAFVDSGRVNSPLGGCHNLAGTNRHLSLGQISVDTARNPDNYYY